MICHQNPSRPSPGTLPCQLLSGSAEGLALCPFVPGWSGWKGAVQMVTCHHCQLLETPFLSCGTTNGIHPWPGVRAACTEDLWEEGGHRIGDFRRVKSLTVPLSHLAEAGVSAVFISLLKQACFKDGSANSGRLGRGNGGVEGVGGRDRPDLRAEGRPPPIC